MLRLSWTLILKVKNPQNWLEFLQEGKNFILHKSDSQKVHKLVILYIFSDFWHHQQKRLFWPTSWFWSLDACLRVQENVFSAWQKGFSQINPQRDPLIFCLVQLLHFLLQPLELDLLIFSLSPYSAEFECSKKEASPQTQMDHLMLGLRYLQKMGEQFKGLADVWDAFVLQNQSFYFSMNISSHDLASIFQYQEKLENTLTLQSLYSRTNELHSLVKMHDNHIEQFPQTWACSLLETNANIVDFHWENFTCLKASVYTVLQNLCLFAYLWNNWSIEVKIAVILRTRNLAWLGSHAIVEIIRGLRRWCQAFKPKRILILGRNRGRWYLWATIKSKWIILWGFLGTTLRWVWWIWGRWSQSI